MGICGEYKYNDCKTLCCYECDKINACSNVCTDNIKTCRDYIGGCDTVKKIILKDMDGFKNPLEIMSKDGKINFVRGGSVGIDLKKTDDKYCRNDYVTIDIDTTLEKKSVAELINILSNMYVQMEDEYEEN